LAVAGMGRSGLGVALAAQRRGARVTVLDEHSADTPVALSQVERLQGAGVEVITGWHGRLEPGFDLLVSSPGFRRNHPAHRDAQTHSIEIASEVEFAFRVSEAPIVAVTGTNGKSTVTVFTWMLLRAAGVDAVLCGNISGSGFPELTLTEAADASRPDQVLVAEISSYQLEWVRHFRPRVASITNITPDHLDRYDGFDDYYATKLRLFAAMGAGDVAVLNLSEPSLPRERLLAAISPECEVREFTGSIQELDSLHGQRSHTQTRREPGALVLSGHQLDVGLLPVVGEHNYVNALQAWEAASAFLASRAAETLSSRLSAMSQLQGLRHRMQVLGERGGVVVINSSMTTNPRAAQACSESLPKRQHLLMGGKTKGLDFTPLRQYLEQSSHQVYVFGQNAVQLTADSLAVQMPNFDRFASLEEAFSAATQNARAGEAILLLPGCLSAFPFENFRDRGDAFIRLAEEWLQS